MSFKSGSYSGGFNSSADESNYDGANDSSNFSSPGGNFGSGRDGGGSYTNNWKNPYAGVARRPADFGQYNDFIYGQFNPDFGAVTGATSQSQLDTALSAYNTASANQNSLFDVLSNRAGKINAFNESAEPYMSQYGSTEGDLQRLLGSLQGMDINQFDQARDDFYGDIPAYADLDALEALNPDSVNVSNTAKIGGRNINLSSQLPEMVDVGDIGALRSSLGSFLNQRDILQGNLDERLSQNRDFQSGLNTTFDQLDRQLDRENYYGDGQLDSMFNQIGNLNNQLSTRDVILDSFRPQFDALQGRLGDIQSGFDTAQTNYDTEAARIDDFLSGIDSRGISMANAIDGLTIADIDDINSYDDQIGQLMSELNNFDSRIDTNLNPYMMEASQLDNRVDSLRDQRTAEQGRIEDDRRRFLSMIRGYERDAGRAGIYDGINLSNLENNLGSMQDNIDLYDSLLNPTFDGVQSGLNNAQASLDSVMAERNNRLGEVQGSIADILGEGMGGELYEEQRMRDALDDLDFQQSILSRFTGDGLADVGFDMTDASRQLEGRLDDLGNYRTGIENRALDMFEGIDPRQYVGFEGLDAYDSQLADLRGEADLYNAFEANNELADIENLLGTQRAALVQDTNMRDARGNREVRQSLADLFGNLDRDYIVNQLASGSIQGEEYESLMRKVQDRDPDFASLIRQQYDALYA